MKLRSVKRFIFLIIGFQILLRSVKKIFNIPAPACMGRLLDSRFRLFLQPPEKVIKRSRIRTATTVLEIGCGSGAYTTYAARIVGDKGKVHALDIQQRMLEQLRQKLERPENRGIKNIEPILGDANRLPFADNYFDTVYLVTALYETSDRLRVLKEVKRVLKPTGNIAVSEFLPDPDYPLRRTVMRDLMVSGFTSISASGTLWHFTVIGYADKQQAKISKRLVSPSVAFDKRIPYLSLRAKI